MGPRYFPGHESPTYIHSITIAGDGCGPGLVLVMHSEAGGGLHFQGASDHLGLPSRVPATWLCTAWISWWPAARWHKVRLSERVEARPTIVPIPGSNCGAQRQGSTVKSALTSSHCEYRSPLVIMGPEQVPHVSPMGLCPLVFYNERIFSGVALELQKPLSQEV